MQSVALPTNTLKVDDNPHLDEHILVLLTAQQGVIHENLTYNENIDWERLPAPHLLKESFKDVKVRPKYGCARATTRSDSPIKKIQKHHSSMDHNIRYLTT